MTHCAIEGADIVRHWWVMRGRYIFGFRSSGKKNSSFKSRGSGQPTLAYGERIQNTSLLHVWTVRCKDIAQLVYIYYDEGIDIVKNEVVTNFSCPVVIFVSQRFLNRR